MINYIKKHILIIIDSRVLYIRNIIQIYLNWEMNMSRRILHRIIDEIGLLEVNTIIIQYLREKASNTEKECFKFKNMPEVISKALMHESIADDYQELNKSIIEMGY
jgi:hypothetical protein